MNNQQRAELLANIAELRKRYPDWRFGQLIANVAGFGSTRKSGMLRMSVT
jgi:hypothetical protein